MAGTAFLVVFVLRANVGEEGEFVLMLNMLPIALLAARFGRWAGLAAAGLGLALVWEASPPGEQLTPLDLLTCAVVFGLVGFGMGWYSEQLRAAVGIAYASEDRYRSLLEYAPEAVVVFDADNRSVQQVNHRALTLFGLTREQFESLGPGALSPPRQPDGRPSDEVAHEKIMQAVQGRHPVFEWTYRTTEGRHLSCEVRLVRLPDPKRLLVRGSITERLQPDSPQSHPTRNSRAAPTRPAAAQDR